MNNSGVESELKTMGGCSPGVVEGDPKVDGKGCAGPPAGKR